MTATRIGGIHQSYGVVTDPEQMIPVVRKALAGDEGRYDGVLVGGRSGHRHGDLRR